MPGKLITLVNKRDISHLNHDCDISQCCEKAQYEWDMQNTEGEIESTMKVCKFHMDLMEELQKQDMSVSFTNNYKGD